jgi:hypothetical protein
MPPQFAPASQSLHVPPIVDENPDQTVERIVLQDILLLGQKSPEQ